MYLEGEAPTKSKEENKEILKEHHLLLVIMNGSQKRYEQIDGIERGKMEQIELDGITSVSYTHLNRQKNQQEVILFISGLY